MAHASCADSRCYNNYAGDGMIESALSNGAPFGSSSKGFSDPSSQTSIVNHLMRDLGKEISWQEESLRTVFKPHIPVDRFREVYTDTVQAVLALGLIYGVETSTACLFQQLFMKYILRSMFKPFMQSNDFVQQRTEFDAKSKFVLRLTQEDEGDGTEM